MNTIFKLEELNEPYANWCGEMYWLYAELPIFCSAQDTDDFYNMLDGCAFE